MPNLLEELSKVQASDTGTIESIVRMHGATVKSVQTEPLSVEVTINLSNDTLLNLFNQEGEQGIRRLYLERQIEFMEGENTDYALRIDFDQRTLTLRQGMLQILLCLPLLRNFLGWEALLPPQALQVKPNQEKLYRSQNHQATLCRSRALQHWKAYWKKLLMR